MPWTGPQFAKKQEAPPLKVCSKCKETLPSSLFSNHAYCKPCGYAYKAERRKTDPAYAAMERASAKRSYEKNRAHHIAVQRVRRLRLNYGITEADFARMLAEQDGKCALCATTEPLGKGQWHIDHDEVSGRVRGLLCLRCNVGLGHYQKLHRRVGFFKVEGYLNAVDR